MMHTEVEYMIAFVNALNVLFDELKITDEKERKRLRMVAASKMGKVLGQITITRLEREKDNK